MTTTLSNNDLATLEAAEVRLSARQTELDLKISGINDILPGLETQHILRRDPSTERKITDYKRALAQATEERDTIARQRAALQSNREHVFRAAAEGRWAEMQKEEPKLKARRAEAVNRYLKAARAMAAAQVAILEVNKEVSEWDGAYRDVDARLQLRLPEGSLPQLIKPGTQIDMEGHYTLSDLQHDILFLERGDHRNKDTFEKLIARLDRLIVPENVRNIGKANP